MVNAIAPMLVAPIEFGTSIHVLLPGTPTESSRRTGHQTAWVSSIPELKLRPQSQDRVDIGPFRHDAVAPDSAPDLMEDAAPITAHA